MKKTLKTNLTNSKKDLPISYLNRYRESNQIKRQSRLNLTVNSYTHWREEQIQERREKIIQNLLQENEVSRIRIQEDSMQTQFFKDDYLDLQIMWLKKVGEIKEQTHKLKVINSKESKTIQTLRQEMEMKRQKLRELQGRIQDNNRNSQDNEIGDDQEQTETTSKEHLKIIQENQNQLMLLQKERQQLLKQNQQLQLNIRKIRSNISELEPKFNALQNRQVQVKNKKEALLIQLRQLRAENKQLEKIVQRDYKLDDEVNLNIGQYIELVQNVFIIKEFQKLEQLMIAKQQQEDRKQIFTQNSKFYKQKCLELQAVNTRVKQKERIAQKLTFDIKQKSIEQLNLYNY